LSLWGCSSHSWNTWSALPPCRPSARHSSDPVRTSSRTGKHNSCLIVLYLPANGQNDVSCHFFQ
jgi:hypothetical protein